MSGAGQELTLGIITESGQSLEECARPFGGRMITRFATLFLATTLLTIFSKSFAAESSEATYFIFGGNPVAVKYISSRVVRLPQQDAVSIADIRALEAVSALTTAHMLRTLSESAEQRPVRISDARVPEYGIPMFNVYIDGSETPTPPLGSLLWSGPPQFRELPLSPHQASERLTELLVSDSRKAIAGFLDFRNYRPVGRRLTVEGHPIDVHDYGHAPNAPNLIFVDVTWRIRDLPDALSNRGIDSVFPLLRVEYVVDTTSRRTIYRDVKSKGRVENHEMRVFREPDGPVLMAVPIECADGADTLILDLEHESYGTGRKSDVAPVEHCFPAI